MSTRVHELAKELGMKSQELLERIHQSGLGVKSSPLASLDEAMVARIKEIVAGGSAAAPPARPRSPAPAPPPAPTPPAVRPAPPVPVAPTPPVPTTPVAPSQPTVESRPVSPPPAPPSPTPQAPVVHQPRTDAPAPAVAERPPLSARPPAPTPERPSPGPTAGPMSATPPAGRPAGHGPLSGHTRPGTGPVHRSGTGPLSGHTSQRGGPTGAPPGRSGEGPGGAQGQSGGPSTPMRPSDYIGPAGTRSMGPRPMPQPNPPVRRPGLGGHGGAGPRPGGPAGGEPRRDTGPGMRTGRPLPPVATPSSGPPSGQRREGPRPPAEPASKTQAPEKRFTPEQFRQMMQSGQLGRSGPGLPGAPRPGPHGHGGPPVRRPGGPAGQAPPPPAAPGAPAGPPTGEFTEEDDRKGGANKTGRLGSAAERASRRAKREQRATDRTRVSSPVDARTILEGDDDSRSHKSQRRQKRGALIAPRKTHAEVEPPITIRSLSEAIGVKANDLIRRLMSMGQLVTINSSLDEEAAVMLAMEFGIEVRVVGAEDVVSTYEEMFEDDEEADDAELEPRPPVITILGHVDHGKTSLLDKIRHANVVASETGGITQHIGAYQIEHNGKKITFVDTPGHEAFTAMRARGANVTDIAIVVVAADDGVMPQTREAIAHARAAEVPVVVALNKIDLPNVDSVGNINKIYGELAQEGLNPTEWGGDTEVIRTSTVTGQGLDDLLSTLELIAELRDLKANYQRSATGTCLESSISEGRGVVATVLVQEGVLRVGDAMVCGDAFGRVRALYNDRGQMIQEAPPSTPVEVSGLDTVPSAGEKFGVIDDISLAREIAETQRSRTRGASLTERPSVTLENLFTRVAEQKVKTLNLILKADVQGSLEALIKELDKLENPEVPIRILYRGVGGISESDILLADASQAIVVGFRVAPEDRAVSLAEEKKIDIRRYDIIYQVTDEVKKAVEGMLVPEVKEVHLGRAVVRQTFRISRTGTVAGCVVTQGLIERSSKLRLIREGREIYKGNLEALKRFKDDVREVREGYECGIKIANYDDVKIDDVIEAYRIDIIRRTL